MVVIKPGNLGNPFSRVWSGKVTPRFGKPSFPKIFFYSFAGDGSSCSNQLRAACLIKQPTCASLVGFVVMS